MQNYANNQGNRNLAITTTQQLDQNPNWYMDLDLVGAQLQSLQLQEW